MYQKLFALNGGPPTLASIPHSPFQHSAFQHCAFRASRSSLPGDRPLHSRRFSALPFWLGQNLVQASVTVVKMTNRLFALLLRQR